MRILGVNGIHNWSWSDDSFTDRFLEALKYRHEVVDVRYPRMWALFAYSDRAIRRRAELILQCHKPGDVLIAHSFGCLASVYAMQLGARFSKVFFFAAAAEQDVEIPEAFEVLYNVHSASDRALFFGAALPFHRFGNLGRFGYIGNNPKVLNEDALGMDHGSYSEPRHVCQWVRYIEERL
jgi:hypothetical protein